MKTSFKTRVSRIGLGIFVNINIFAVCLYFFESLKSKSTQMWRPQNGNSGVSFNDTLLNFGLRCTSHKFVLCRLLGPGPSYYRTNVSWKSFLCYYLSMVKATMVSIEAYITPSVTVIFISQASSPNGQGYCCHIKYSSPGITG